MASVEQDLAVRPSRHGRTLGFVVTVVGLVALLGWYSQRPDPLPLDTRTIGASTPVSVPVYVGVANGIEGRTLDLAGVKVFTTSNTELDVTPLLCRNGRIDVTSDPTPFCAELVNPEGQTLSATDSVVLEVSSDVPAVAVIDPVRLAFREGVQWDTVPTGRGAVVRVIAR